MRKTSFDSAPFSHPLPCFHGDGCGFPGVWAKRSPTAGDHPFQSAGCRPETGRSRRLPRFQQALLDLDECLEGRAVPAEVQDPLPRLADELGGAVDDFLQHRLDAPALGRVAHRAGFSQKADLADEAQAVVGQHPQVQHEVVAVELGRRAGAPGRGRGRT